jgi:tetrahydromethanopterin S-methyltransferase subunit C
MMGWVKDHYRALIAGVCGVAVPVITIVNVPAGVVAGSICAVVGAVAGVQYKKISDLVQPVLDTLKGKK